MRKKALIMPWTFTITVPIILLSLVFLGLAVIILSQLLSTTISISSKSVNTDAALYAMLNSNDCTPNTKLQFKDVLAIGIGEGKSDVRERVALDYGGATDGNTNLGGLRIEDCFPIFESRLNLFGTGGISSYKFYVEYPGCPGKKCFLFQRAPTIVGTRTTSTYSTESVGYIAIPNGSVAKAVLLLSK